MGHELYLAPEDMYTKLGLPAMILAAVKDFCAPVRKNLLSNIVLSGGNCRLSGLANRLTRDLHDVFSRHEDTIRVCDPRLLPGRTDAVVGGSYVKRWEHVQWITKYDYVINGFDCLTRDENVGGHTV